MKPNQMTDAELVKALTETAATVERRMSANESAYYSEASLDELRAEALARMSRKDVAPYVQHTPKVVL